MAYFFNKIKVLILLRYFYSIFFRMIPELQGLLDPYYNTCRWLIFQQSRFVFLLTSQLISCTRDTNLDFFCLELGNKDLLPLLKIISLFLFFLLVTFCSGFFYIQLSSWMGIQEMDNCIVQLVGNILQLIILLIWRKLFCTVIFPNHYFQKIHQ